ncbi:hypothetical protein N9L46_02525 [Amylibacter sp.]|nr:hypothetical protein [Amylibacter sp.]MDA9005828.1 hypothetical protein [Amylibacter sp.]MDB4070912.1 hypothetical protein [Amylibacter sp.]MDB4411501.1 endodeoxyribonuclease [bacterium]|tara:strand:- start:7064 stop:7519 length:456 start_codon:yes stop_codon:yes gene_type:complete
MKWILLLTFNTGRVSTARSALRARAIKNGWRSGLEESLASDLHSKGVSFEYEEHRLPYKVPSRIAHYTPDFYITTKSGKVIVVESKGRFVTADRQKMLLVKAQHPHLDIRMVFSNPNTKISKQSKTTYGKWCQKHGFKYAKGLVPESWLDE